MVSLSPIEQRYYDLHPGSAERHDNARGLFPNGVTHDARKLNPFQLYFTHAMMSTATRFLTTSLATAL